jgi:hypothetical protein
LGDLMQIDERRTHRNLGCRYVRCAALELIE